MLGKLDHYITLFTEVIEGGFYLKWSWKPFQELRKVREVGVDGNNGGGAPSLFFQSWEGEGRKKEGRKEGRLHFKKIILLLFKIFFFIFVATLGLSCSTWSLLVSAWGVFSWGMWKQTLSCGMWGLSSSLQHVGSRSLTRHGPWAPFFVGLEP